jgi:hypothetical protein
MEFEFVWRQADVRAVRRARWVRNRRINDTLLPRRLFDGRPDALAALRERAEAAGSVRDRDQGPSLIDGGDARAAGAVGAQ